MAKRKKSSAARPTVIEEAFEMKDSGGESYDIGEHVRLALSTALATLEASPLYPSAREARREETPEASIPLVSELAN